MNQIAVVDDNEAWRFVVATCLRQYGFEVSTFSDADEFFRAARSFDLVLVDFSMPSRHYQKEVDGCEFIKTVKAKFQHPPLLVLISAYFLDDSSMDAQSICPEADACLGKRGGMENLVQTVQRLLAARSKTSQYSQLTQSHY